MIFISMEHNENSETKIKFILSLFKFYQPNLTIPEQIELLLMWQKSCVEHEEYEMAAALKKELDKIKKKPNKAPQKKKSDASLEEIKEDPSEIYFFEYGFDDEPTSVEEPEPVKKSFIRRFLDFFKKLFNK